MATKTTVDNNFTLMKALNFAVSLGGYDALQKIRPKTTRGVIKALCEEIPGIHWRNGHERTLYSAYKAGFWNQSTFPESNK